jgi:hypothetical protein
MQTFLRLLLFIFIFLIATAEFGDRKLSKNFGVEAFSVASGASETRLWRLADYRI